MITQRAVLVGIVGFCFYLIALVNALPAVYYTLAWLSVGILVSSLGVAFLSVVGLECRWHVAGARASELLDEDASGAALVAGARLGIEASNVGTLNKTGIAVEVRLFDIRRDRMRAQQFLVEVLPSGASLSSELPLHAPGHGLPRGRYFVSEVWLVGSDVLGLFRARKRADAGLRRVRVFDDGVVPLDDVTSALQKATGHSDLVCAAVARKARFEGDAVCFRGLSVECRRAITALAAVGLKAEETRDANERRFRLTRRGPLARKRRVRVGSQTFSGKQLDALARHAALMPGAGFEIVIGPAMAQAGAVSSSAGGNARDGDASRTAGPGEEFRGTRPYAAGDDLRRVHWASSARRGQLVVREFLRPAQDAAVVIWDGAASGPPDAKPHNGRRATEESLAPGDMPTAGAPSAGAPSAGAPSAGAPSDAREEAGLRLAASLCRALLERGRPCGLLRLDEHPLWLPPTGNAELGGALGRVIESLADARADRRTSFAEAVRGVAGARVEGEVFLVTTAARDALPLTRAAAQLWQTRGARLCVIWVAPEGTTREGTTRESTTRESTTRDVGVPNANGANDSQGAQSVAGADVALRAARPGEAEMAPVREALSALLGRSGGMGNRGARFEASAASVASEA